MRKIIFRTSSQDTVIEVSGKFTLEEILRSRRLPPNLFQGYIKNGNIIKPIHLRALINDIPIDSEIVLQCIRNTDLRHVLPHKTEYKRINDPITFISSFNLNDEEVTETVYEINADKAKKIVEERVLNFLNENCTTNNIIVGVSGGGDSNTLIECLNTFSIERKSKIRFLFFTIIFEPIWPATGAKRASKLCEKMKAEHLIFDSDSIQSLLKMKGNLSDCFNQFSLHFGKDTSHFFGTYLIYLVSKRLCEVYKAKEFILGYNREDLLAEMLYSLINGQKPLSFPVRRFGDILLLMPLWEVQKSILDSCYPSFSLKNYEERDHASSKQRDLIYFLAHSIEDAYDNLGLSLMHGIQNIFENNWGKLLKDDELDLYISPYADKDRVNEIRYFFSKYFIDSTN